MDKTGDLQYIKMLIEGQFQVLNKRLNSYDKNISKILERLNRENKQPTFKDYVSSKEIKVVSYMDD